MIRLTRTIAVMAAFFLLLSACGGDDDAAVAEDDTATEAADEEAAAPEAADDEEAVDDEPADDEAAGDDEAADGGYPVVVATSSGDVVLEARPEKIVSMSPSATEMLFAIGAGEQVAAVDNYSNYPAEAPITDLSAFEPNLEAIATYEPDLVVLGFPNPEIEAGLADLGVPVLVLNAASSIDDTYEQIAQLGEATGELDGAAAVNAEIRSGIDEIVANLPESDEPVRVYHELDDTFFSASSSSFIGQMYSLLGFENIADPADPDGGGFPQLVVDQIVEGDPTLIVFTDAYDYGPEDIAARPGWDALTAVANNNIVEVDADVASRWGPRIVEFLQLIVDSVSVTTG